MGNALISPQNNVEAELPKSKDRDLSESISSLTQEYGEDRVAQEVSRWYSERGIHYYRNGLIETAADHFIKAMALARIRLGHNAPNTHVDQYSNALLLGTCYQRMNRLAEASEYFQLALRIDPRRFTDSSANMEFFFRHGTTEQINRCIAIEETLHPVGCLARSFRIIDSIFPEMVGRFDREIRSAVRKNSKKPVLPIVVPVWGAKFAEMLLRYALPCWLAPGNFPSLAHSHHIRLVVFCDSATELRIRNSRLVGTLAQCADIAFIPYGDELTRNQVDRVVDFQLFSLPHYVSLECARRLGCDVAFAFPDNIVNDGFYREVGSVLKGDVSALVCQGFRLPKDKVLPTIDERYRQPNGTIALPSEAIVELLVDHLDDAWFAASRNFTNSPFVTCWRVGSDGILARSSHLQPYAIRGRCISEELSPRIDPLDGQFLNRYLTDRDKLRCIDDARMCVFDVSEQPNMDGPAEERRLEEYRYARFLYEYLTPVHRHYLNVPIKLAKGGRSAEWTKAEAESDRVIAETLRIVDGFKRTAPVCPWTTSESALRKRQAPTHIA